MINLEKRLQNAMRDGNLTIADLARWFSRSFATVRSWTRGTEMNGAPGDSAIVIDRLKLIEKRIRLKKGLPVPQFVANGKLRAPSMRIAYLNQLMARKKM